MPLFDITENDRKIYETELRDFLPDEIFDVHAHIWRDELRIKHKDEPKRKVTWPTLVAKDDPIEDLAAPAPGISALMLRKSSISPAKRSAHLSLQTRAATSA